MPGDPDQKFVITGGPGAGKTTLINALEVAGFSRTVEAGRDLIRDQWAIDGMALPWRNPNDFAELMLCWEMRSYRMAQDAPSLVICDRGVPDVIGYLRQLGMPIPAHMQRAAEIFRYNRQVFIAPPWREIFKQDDERRQCFEEAVRTYEAMTETYLDLGYDLIEIPRASVAARVDFVTEKIRKASMTRNDKKVGRGYIYVEMLIKDPEKFKDYTALSAPAVHAAGGRYLVRGACPEVLEGRTDFHRVGIVEFESVALARQFYYSAVYQAARDKRRTAAEFRMTLLEGTPTDAKFR